MSENSPADQTPGNARDARAAETPPPHVPDHELLRRIGAGSYGDVWLARNVMGTYRAVKMVYRHTFDHARPFEREFTGIQKFEPVSRLHDGLVDILQVGRNDQAGYFYYVMEVADPVGLERTRAPGGNESDKAVPNAAKTGQSDTHCCRGCSGVVQRTKARRRLTRPCALPLIAPVWTMKLRL